MSEISALSPTSALDASQVTQAPASSLDASQVDKNLRQVNLVTSSWSLPDLPDSVKLDLASQPGVDHKMLSGFLTGVDSDLNANGVPDSQERDKIPSLLDTIQPTGLDNTRRIIAGVANQPPPTNVSGDSVKRWKMDAIDKGYLPAPQDGQIDSSWSPEFSTIQKQMAWDQTNASYRGDRAGSIPFNKAVDLLGKWTSPSGLLQAATNLDLWWDTGAISKEFSTWGDKFRKLGRSKSPLDFAKNLFDAATGPLDDIILPAANWALMLTGVSEAYEFGKVAWMGEKAIAGAEAVDGLYDVAKTGNILTRGYDAAKDVENFGEASGLANRLSKADSTVANFVGDKMAAWRELPGVTSTKKFVQTGMKLGVASQAEDLLPNYHGKSVGDQSSVKAALSWANQNPILSASKNITDILFTPYATFKPGTFTGGAKTLVSKGAEFLGTVPGRALAGGLVGAGIGTLTGHDLGDTAKGAVIGAGAAAAAPAIGSILSGASEDVPVLSKLMPKAVGHVGDFLKLSSFKPLSENQQLTSAVHQGMLAFLGDKPEALKAYTDDFDKSGFLTAFGNHMGVDDEAAAGALGYVMTSASIDHIASSQAKTFSQDYQKVYHTVRNKLTSQIKAFDLENVGTHTLTNIAAAAAKNTGNERAEFSRLLEDFKADPSKALEYASKHNQMAQNTIRQLMSVQSLPDLDPEAAAHLYGWTGMGNEERLAVFQKYLPQVMDKFGNWPQYTAHMSGLDEHLGAGLLDDAVFSTFKDAAGNEKAIPRSGLKPKVPVGGESGVPVLSTSQEVSQTMNEQAFRTEGVDPEKLSSIDILARGADPTQGKFTLMRAGSPTEQDIRSVHAELSDLYRSHMDMNRIGPKLQAYVKDASTGSLDDLSRSEFASAFANVSNKDSKRLGHLYDFAKRRGISLDEAQLSINGMLDDAVNDPRITDTFGLGQGVRGKPDPGEAMGPALTGGAALKERISQLAKKAQFTAAGVDHDKLLASLGEGTPEYAQMSSYLDSLDNAGYKLAHGVDFLMPQDVAFHTPIFEDIGRRHMNAATLGNFFGGKLPAEARLAQDRHARLVVADELDKIGSSLDTSVHSADVNNIMTDLRSILTDQQMVAKGVQNDALNSSWLQKRIAAVKTSTTPVQMTDLRTREKAVLEYLTPRYGEDNAKAAYKALARMRNTDFQDVGLAAIEAKLRTNNQLSNGLHILSGTDHGSGIISRTTLGRNVGAAAGAIYATQTNGNGNDLVSGLEGAAIGGALGTVGQGALSPLAQKAQSVFDNSKWFKYGYMADNLARLRDTMRFTLSPFFDISRYTEGLMLGQTAAPLRDAEGARVALPLNMSPSKIIRGWTKDAGGGIEARAAAESKWQGVLSQFSAASRGQVDAEATDVMQQWFQQVGIMGFNPQNWQAAAFHHLREAGFDAESAFEHSKAMYTYGTHGRSAAEQSVNTIFFPFSFQKKSYTHLVKYLADDQSRAVILHDALKTYDMLNQKFDLSHVWRDHAPALQMLQRLNLFAYGLSPGKLGGINRPFIEPLVNAAINAHGQTEAVPGILNLFNPQGVSIKSAADAAQVTKLTRTLLPAMNDINSMVQDLKEQGHVIFSPLHQTNAADASQGWSEWNQYKADLGAQLKQRGYDFSDLANKSYLAPLNVQYKAKQAELGAKYPGWKASRTSSLMNFEAANAEKTDRINDALAGRGSEADNMMLQFENAIKPVKAQMSSAGITDTADLPPEIFQQIQNLGVKFGQTSLEWRRIWKKFYAPAWGLIETPAGG